MPAILDHRVVTLHPKIHGGLLADPTNATHRADMAEYGIEAIDLLVCNLYPFATDPSIELIDIGGPAMVRAAAKNHQFVAVVVDPSDYARRARRAARRWRDRRGDEARRLARDAFARIAAYDAADCDVVRRHAPTPVCPTPCTCRSSKVQPLRYGENPHQTGARYRVDGRRSWWDDAVQHGGKEMSYLNLFDTEAAWRLVQRFDEPACVIVKHANPCGVAVARRHHRRLRQGQRLRSRSARSAASSPSTAPCPRALADALAPVFTEVIVAPSFDDDALAILTREEEPARAHRSAAVRRSARHPLDRRRPAGAGRRHDQPRSDRRGASSPRPTPTDAQWTDLRFAWQVCAAVSSNAIVYAKDRQAFGIGAGQQNRLDSARIAAERSAGRAEGGVCASDAFFPFRDGLDAAAAAGIRAVIQPGGSVRDDEVIAAADEHGIAMVFTGERHFRH